MISDASALEPACHGVPARAIALRPSRVGSFCSLHVELLRSGASAIRDRPHIAGAEDGKPGERPRLRRLRRSGHEILRQIVANRPAHAGRAPAPARRGFDVTYFPTALSGELSLLTVGGVAAVIKCA